MPQEVTSSFATCTIGSVRYRLDACNSLWACSFSADTRASLSWPRLLTPIPDVRSIYFFPSISQRVAPFPWSSAQPESGHMYALNKVVLRLSIPDMSYFPPAYENIVPTPSLLSKSIRIEWGTRPSCILALSTPGVPPPHSSPLSESCRPR